ncbi:hypothetical protein [Glycocaulis sp.]
MEILDTVWGFVEPVWAWLRAGLDAHYAGGWTQLGIQMGVIGVVMALMMQSFGAILIFTVVAMIIHVVVDQVLPMVRDGAAFAIPPVADMSYWQYIAFLAVAYFAGLIVLFLIKSIIFRR